MSVCILNMVLLQYYNIAANAADPVQVLQAKRSTIEGVFVVRFLSQLPN